MAHNPNLKNSAFKIVRISINGQAFSSGTSQGKPVDWMDARGEEMTMWQAMLDRPNLWIDGTLILRPNMEKRKF